jgi:hypothetical protein
VKIHRAFQRIATDWHDVEKVGAKGYRVHQEFDPYERDEKGQPLKWSQKMEKEYEGRVEKLRLQKEFSDLSKVEKEKVATQTLTDYYKIFHIEMNDFDDWKKKVKKWEDKVKKLKLNVPIKKLRNSHGVPENRDITRLRKEDIDKLGEEKEVKLTQEDIKKYGTVEEKNILNESLSDGGHNLQSDCCSANFLYDEPEMGICSRCKEHCGYWCEVCGKEFATIDEANKTPCID